MPKPQALDLWMRQSATVMPEALEEGFRGFTWQIGISMAKQLDPIARTRAYALPYGENIRIMLIDYAGAQEYDLFSSYDKPLAVYPTWAPDESEETLRWMCANPAGQNSLFYNDAEMAQVYRPVKDQKHRVVIHRLPNGKDMGARHDLLMLLRDLQAEFDHTGLEIFVTGLSSYDQLFNYGLLAADYKLAGMIDSAIYPRIVLPSGKSLPTLSASIDPRYADWFELIGITQAELAKNLDEDSRLWPRFNMRSVQWARRNWHLVEPFVGGRRVMRPADYEANPNFIVASNASFVLPGTRRRVMRNLSVLGFKPSELDQFLCDTCILHNTCKLYREGSVCTVEGAETVALADAFGTRSARGIIDGLNELMKRQAERLDDALALEDAAEPNPDVTRQMNALFANAVKLAKLLDPTLTGPRVQVNVGVAGNAAVQVGAADPRQVTASVVAELEAQGIKREDITADMLAGVFKRMGITGIEDDPEVKAIEAAAANAKPRGRPAGRPTRKAAPKAETVPIMDGFIVLDELNEAPDA